MAKSTKVKEDKIKIKIAPSTITKEDVEELTDQIKEAFKDKPLKVTEGVFNPVFDKKEAFENVDTSVKFVEIPKVVEEKTEQRKIMDYVSNSHSEVVDLSPIIRSLYPLPTYAEPALYLRQSESKKIMGLIASMKASGDIALVDNRYLNLGKNYWADGDTKTRHYNIDTVKILAIKK